MVVNQDREEISGINFEKKVRISKLYFIKLIKFRFLSTYNSGCSYLQYQQYYEVSICHPLELLEQVDGQEGEDVVL